MAFKLTITENPRLKKLDQVFDLTGLEVREMIRVGGIEYAKQSVQVFATEGRASGRKWRRLTDEYARRKRARWGRRKILVASGDLRHGLTRRSSDDFIARAYIRNKRLRAQFGTFNPLALYHGDFDEHNPNLPIRDPVRRSQIQTDVLVKRILKDVVEPGIARGFRVMSSVGRRLRGPR